MLKEHILNNLNRGVKTVKSKINGVKGNKESSIYVTKVAPTKKRRKRMMMMIKKHQTEFRKSMKL